MIKAMSLERLRELALAYGAELERWPNGERAAARELCRTSDEALRIVAEEEALDRVFAQASEPPAPAPALFRRLNEVPVRSAQRRVYWPFGRAWIPAVSWAFAAVLGLGWGITSAPFDTTDATDEGATSSVASVDSAAGDTLAAEDDLDALVGGSLAELE